MRAIRDEARPCRPARMARPRTRLGATFLSSYARTLTNGSLRFHTDRTDVVACSACARRAPAASASSPSTPAIHNAILAKRPDLLDELFKDFWRSLFGEEAPPRKPAYPLAIFGPARRQGSSRTIRSPSSRPRSS